MRIRREKRDGTIALGERADDPGVRSRREREIGIGKNKVQWGERERERHVKQVPRKGIVFLYFSSATPSLSLSLSLLLMMRLSPAREIHDLGETAATHVMRAPIFLPYSLSFFGFHDGEMETTTIDEKCAYTTVGRFISGRRLVGGARRLEEHVCDSVGRKS